MAVGRKLKIYLSYVNENSPIVSELYNRLSADGFLPWMDKMNLEPGQEWEVTMDRVMTESDVIIACLSRYSYHKEGYIQNEYKKIEKIALEKPKGIVFLIPLRLEECEIPDLFRPYHWLDYFDTNGYEKLVKSLLRRAGQLGLFVDPQKLESQKHARSLITESQSDDILENIKNTRDETERVKEILDFSKGGLFNLTQKQFENLLNQVYSINDQSIRVNGLIGLVPHLNTESRTRVLQDAINIVQQMKDEVSRASVLSSLAPHLNDELKAQALAVAREIEEESARASALISLAPHLTDELKSYVLPEALAAARAIKDESVRASALISLAPHLTDELKSYVLPEALAATREIKDQSARARALAALLPYLNDELKSQISEEDLAKSTAQPNILDNEDRKSTNIIRPFNIDENALDKHVTTDKPVQSVKQDKLDFKIYVNALHSFILSKYTTTPIAISIDGVWGTGKSSLMSMLKGKLDPQRDGVRKFFEWWWLLWSRIKWYFWFIYLTPARVYGKTLIALNVRTDGDDDNVHLYLFEKYPCIQKYFADIVRGFAIDLEVFNQPGNEIKDKWVAWWALVNARSEAMEPPYHYTVWLNAWKFDNQEEVWASLALATMEQIKQKHGLLWRLRFWWELTFSRFSFWSGLGQVVKQFLLPLVFAIVLASYNTIIESVTVPLDAFTQYGSPLLWAGFVISGILSVSSIFKDPFQIPLDKVFDRPNYKDKVKFLSHFEKDFARIVRAATKNGFGWKRSKLVIFIDDLDRCEPPKSADIVEAVNLFLDAEGCVFVIGMDSESVARSIEVKYKDLFERIKAENTGVVSLGRLFLDKIVQIPFSMPRPTPGQIMSMVNDALGSKVLSLSANISMEFGSKSPAAGASGAPIADSVSGQVVGTHTEEQKETIPPISQPRIDAASYARPEVRAAIRKGTELLADNPRQVKTFINLFRLSVYIANERKLLEEKIIGEKTSGLNLDKLAAWTACTVRWPGLVRHLYTETQIDSLCQFACDVSQAITPEFRWQTGHKNIPAELKKKIDNRRKAEKGSEAHWCHLPWDWWLLEPDFLKAVKILESLWAPSTDKGSELNVLLNMSRPLSPMTSTEAK